MRWIPAVSFLFLLSCVSATAPPPADQPIPPEWLQVAQTPRFPALSYDAGGVLLYVPRTPADSAVHIVKSSSGAKLANGEKDLTPEFLAIDSFDVSLDRREVSFSAKRKDNFDIGLVSLDGSEVRWVPEDPADETGVQWAPRGNKISYVVHTHGGDLVRTVHIPTSMQLATDFPDGRVHALAWEPRAERYAVSWSSVDASDRVELMTYAGDDRKIVVEPAVRLDASAEPIGGALVLRPPQLRYNEKLPLVVWRTSDRNEWSDARGQLQRVVPVACAVIDHDPDDAFWKEIAAVPWIDMNRVYAVGIPQPASRSPQSNRDLAPAAGGRAVYIHGDSAITPGRYRQIGNSVSVAPALVQSFGAAWVAHQLKGNPPPNGSHR